MSMLEAARMGDKVAHSNALLGFLTGMVVGAVFAVGLALLAGATLATGGGALVLAGALLAGAGGGALKGMSLGARSKSGSGDPIKTGAARTFIGTDRKRAARAEVDEVTCHTGKHIAQGSKTVFIEQHAAARKTDQTECGGKIDEGWPTVFIGKEAETYLAIESEVPEWMVRGAQIALVVGTVLGLLGGVVMAGVAVTAGGFLGGMAGGKLGAIAGGWIGEQLGGADGRAWGEAIGEEVGGFLGGAAGGRLGGKANAAEIALSSRALAGRPKLAARIAKIHGESPTAIAARQQVARAHYEKTRPFSESGKTRAEYDRDINSNMAGIDFRKPVEVKPVAAGTTLYTYNKPGARNAGSYFTEQKERPTDIGISENVTITDASGASVNVPKEIYTVKLAKEVDGLYSTASPKLDTFSTPNKQADGSILGVAESGGGRPQININTSREKGSDWTQAKVFEETAPGSGSVMKPASDTSAGYRDPSFNQNTSVPGPLEYNTAPIYGDTAYKPPTQLGVPAGNLGEGTDDEKP